MILSGESSGTQRQYLSWVLKNEYIGQVHKSIEEYPVRGNRVFELLEGKLEGDVHQEGTQGGTWCPL